MVVKGIAVTTTVTRAKTTVMMTMKVAEVLLAGVVAALAQGEDPPLKIHAPIPNLPQTLPVAENLQPQRTQEGVALVVQVTLVVKLAPVVQVHLAVRVTPLILVALVTMIHTVQVATQGLEVHIRPLLPLQSMQEVCFFPFSSIRQQLIFSPGDPKTSPATGTGGKSPSSSIATVSAVLPNGGSSTPSPPVLSPNPSSSPTGPSPQGALQHRDNRGAIAGGIVGALFILFLVFVGWTLYKRRRKTRIAPSAEYLANPASYPFARAGFGGKANMSEKTNSYGGANNYGGAGKGAAGQANFDTFSTDSRKGVLNEKRPSPPPKEVLRDQNLIDPLPPPPQPEILYSTPPRGASPPIIPATPSNPGTPTSPRGRRIPFGTGTFQFPPRPPQSPQ